MQWTRRRVIVISVVAAVLAVTITSLASGVSLRKLVKKEVSKQISNATGPQGVQGQQGSQGQQGPVGPTHGDIQGPIDPVPVTPDSLPVVGLSNTVTAPAPGRLLVIFSMDALSVDCPTSTPEIGLYVDGVRVPGTYRILPDNMTTTVNIFGVSAPVAAGDRVVAVGATCGGPEVPAGAGAGTNRSLGAVLIGS